jgi:Leucine-rich repeat (LRR) protein
MTTTKEIYFNSLSEDILIIDISYKNIKSLPDLTRFKNLKKLYCGNNKLTSLPNLPQNIEELYCCNNKLTSLPTLPPNLITLNCSNNKLTSLPTLPLNLIALYCRNNQLTSLPALPPNLIELYCRNNQLTSLPSLPQNLQVLYCYDNELTSLPTLPQNLQVFCCNNNPIYKIVNINSLSILKQNIQILNKFRYLYYCVKFKKHLRKWLWEKVREPNIMKMYHPKYLIENLGENDDLDTFLDNWK